MATKIKVEGLRELERALAELPKATGKNVLRRIAKGALEPMANVAASKAPVGRGVLSFSISVSEKRTTRARFRPRLILSKGRYKVSPSTGLDMAMGPAAGLGALQYATFVEFGTVDTVAVPFMRPAWDGGAMKALGYIKDNLGVEIDKAAKRLARKRAKAGR